MRLIMRVHKSDYDFGYTNVFPIEYADKAQFLADLEIAFHYWNDRRSELQAQINDRAKVFASINRPDKQRDYHKAEIKPLMEQMDDLNKTEKLTIGVNKISISDIYQYDYGFLTPDVFTVDEFFEKVGL